MIRSNKHPGMAFWATVALVAVLGAYPLSFGPACWITSRLDHGSSVIGTVYWPVLIACWKSDLSWRWIFWYATIGAQSGWTVEMSDGGKFLWVNTFH